MRIVSAAGDVRDLEVLDYIRPKTYQTCCLMLAYFLLCEVLVSIIRRVMHRVQIGKRESPLCADRAIDL